MSVNGLVEVALCDTADTSIVHNVDASNLMTNSSVSSIVLDTNSKVIIDGDEYTGQEVKDMFKILKEMVKERNPELFI